MRLSGLDLIKPGAEAFFAWADKDEDGHVSFGEARAVIEILAGFKGQNLIADSLFSVHVERTWNDWVREGDAAKADCDLALGPNREQLGVGLHYVMNKRNKLE